MERILYNSKLKKILISLLAAILMLQFMMPSVVLAKTIEKTNYEYSYKQWITNEETKENKDVIENATIKY